MTTMERVLWLHACLVPYAWFGLRDVWHHKTHRRVPMAERALHTAIGLSLMVVVPHACLGHRDVVVPGLVLFVTARGLDEFIFHRGLAGEEVDLHAKTHLGFLFFVVGLMGMNWWEGASLP